MLTAVRCKFDFDDFDFYTVIGTGGIVIDSDNANLGSYVSGIQICWARQEVQ